MSFIQAFLLLFIYVSPQMLAVVAGKPITCNTLCVYYLAISVERRTASGGGLSGA